jgi:hypothetical protein
LLYSYFLPDGNAGHGSITFLPIKFTSTTGTYSSILLSSIGFCYSDYFLATKFKAGAGAGETDRDLESDEEDDEEEDEYEDSESEEREE